MSDDRQRLEFLAQLWLYLDNDHDPEVRARMARLVDRAGAALDDYGIPAIDLRRVLFHPQPGREWDRDPDSLRQRLRIAILEQCDVSVATGPDGRTTTTVSARAVGPLLDELTAATAETLGMKAMPVVQPPARVAVRLLSKVVSLLPEQGRDRYDEEFRSELFELAESGALR